MKISVITPSVRPEGLPMVRKALEAQTFKGGLEWIVCSPADRLEDVDGARVIAEPPRNEGDFYGLNKALNALVAASQGELLVICVDYTCPPPNALQTMWDRYTRKKWFCTTVPVRLCANVENDVPKDVAWIDPRIKWYPKGWSMCKPQDFDFALASIPSKAFAIAGGIDETFDRFAGMSEKEFMIRATRKGYEAAIDTEMPVYGWMHPAHGPAWDEAFKGAEKYLEEVRSQWAD